MTAHVFVEGSLRKIHIMTMLEASFPKAFVIVPNRCAEWIRSATGPISKADVLKFRETLQVN